MNAVLVFIWVFMIIDWIRLDKTKALIYTFLISTLFLDVCSTAMPFRIKSDIKVRIMMLQPNIIKISDIKDGIIKILILSTRIYFLCLQKLVFIVKLCDFCSSSCSHFSQILVEFSIAIFFQTLSNLNLELIYLGNFMYFSFFM